MEMAVAESAFVSRAAVSLFSKRRTCTRKSRESLGNHNKLVFYSRIQASHSMDDKEQVYKQLGLFSLKKKIEDVVCRAEMLAPTALELEEARRIKQEEMIREFNLWDDPVKSNDVLVKLADSAKAVDALKDLKYKAEEAKLISELAEKEAMNYQLFEQAYSASLDVCKLLNQYEMSKLLKGPYDMEGACVVIKTGSQGTNSEVWAEELLTMYINWAEKLGSKGRLVEKHRSIVGGIHFATVEFEFEGAYGYLSGERGIHRMMSSPNGSGFHEVSAACVEVIPLFLGMPLDLQISDEDLIISSSYVKEEDRQPQPTVCLQHIPTGITVQCSGERSHFANKIKALNRLKAKLLVIAEEQKVSDANSIKRDALVDLWQEETRRYITHPYKLVHDVKTGIQLPDLKSILDGNIEPFIAAHANARHSD